jgi:hypothetical protein
MHRTKAERSEVGQTLPPRGGAESTADAELADGGRRKPVRYGALQCHVTYHFNIWTSRPSAFDLIPRK